MKKRIIIIVTILIVLTGFYFAIEKLGDKENTDNSEIPPMAETINIFKTEKDAITQINISTPEFSYSFVKKEDKWIVLGNEKIKLNNSRVEGLAYDFASINAEAIIEDNNELSAFGLNKPIGTPSIVLADGNVKRFTIGNKTPTGNSYYFMAEGNELIYSVYSSKVEDFTSPLSYYRDTFLAKFDPAKLTEIQIKRSNSNIILRAKTEQEIKEESLSLNPWKMISPDMRDISSYSLEEKVLKKIVPFEVSEFIEDEPQSYGKYGLDKPNYTISLKEDEKPNWTIMLGNYNGDDEVYARIEGEKAVYSLKTSSFEFRDISPMDLLDTLIYIKSIDTVNEISLKTTDANYNFTIKHEGENATYFVNGTAADESAFKKAYQELIGLTLRGNVSEQPTGQTIFTMIFNFNNGSSDDIVEGVLYGERYVAIRVNGVAKHYLLKEQVTSMLENIKKFSENPAKQ